MDTTTIKMTSISTRFLPLHIHRSLMLSEFGNQKYDNIRPYTLHNQRLIWEGRPRAALLLERHFNKYILIHAIITVKFVFIFVA